MCTLQIIILKYDVTKTGDIELIVYVNAKCIVFVFYDND